MANHNHGYSERSFIKTQQGFYVLHFDNLNNTIREKEEIGNV
ncbi:hypothetical protein [Aquimarina aggregata]|nr:hypothetical protein [Aquimarina aggregata]